MFSQFLSKSLEGNIWKYTFFSICNKRSFIPILSAFYLSIEGVTAVHIGYLTAIGALVSFIFEIPSGYMADKIGHKMTLIMSRFLMVISSLGFIFADSFLVLAIASSLFGLAFTFHSGTGSAFMHETFKGLDREKDFTSVMGKIHSIGFAVPAVLSLLVPFLVLISDRAPFVFTLILDIVALLISISFSDPKVKDEHVFMLDQISLKKAVKEGFKTHYFRLKILGSILLGAMIGMSPFRAAYQLELGVPVVYYGILFSIGRLLASLLLAYNGKIKEYLTLHTFYLFRIGLFFSIFLALGFFEDPVIVVSILIFMNAMTWGFSGIGTGFTMEIIGGSRYKSTLISINSQINHLVAIFIGLLFGVFVEVFSYSQAYLYSGILLCTALMFIYIFCLKGFKIKSIDRS
jgi:MFS family permease